MKSLARSSLGLLGLALAAPAFVNAQDPAPSAPAGYSAPAGLDGKPVAGLAVPAAAAAPARALHKHKGKTLCARCAAAQNSLMAPPGRIVGCAHSKNGVCTACAAALALPGEVVMAGTPAVPEAPGRAVASSDSRPLASPSTPMMARQKPAGTRTAPYDGPTDEPTPIGVMQANFAPGAPMGMPASGAGPGSASAPGRAVAESGAGPAPYRPKGRGITNPHILGHLFGWSGIGAERADDRARHKAEAHAMIPYNNEGTTVDELPASQVFGRR